MGCTPCERGGEGKTVALFSMTVAAKIGEILRQETDTCWVHAHASCACLFMRILIGQKRSSQILVESGELTLLSPLSSVVDREVNEEKNLAIA